MNSKHCTIKTPSKHHQTATEYPHPTHSNSINTCEYRGETHRGAEVRTPNWWELILIQSASISYLKWLPTLGNPLIIGTKFHDYHCIGYLQQSSTIEFCLSFAWVLPEFCRNCLRFRTTKRRKKKQKKNDRAHFIRVRIVNIRYRNESDFIRISSIQRRVWLCKYCFFFP